MQKLIQQHHPGIICIQETKLESVHRNLYAALRGSEDFDWAFNLSVGRSGGLLMIWGETIFI